MITALIIDDEKLARDVIKTFLKSYDDITVLAECSNGFEGLKMIQEHNPDLVFLDIQMPKLTGFEMLELVEEKPVVIFSTAFDEYAIKAFELSAADYLLKPYSSDRFKAAVEKAKNKLSKNEDGKSADVIIESHREVQDTLDRVVIRSGTKIIIISVKDVDYFEAQDDYVAVHSNGKKYLKQLTMKYLGKVLSKGEFVRIHRSYIANVSRIDRLEAYSKDSYLAILTDGNKLPVSRSGYQALKEVLNF